VGFLIEEIAAVRDATLGVLIQIEIGRARRERSDRRGTPIRKVLRFAGRYRNDRLATKCGTQFYVSAIVTLVE